MLSSLKAGAAGPTSNLYGCWNHGFSDTEGGSGSYSPVGSCVGLWLVDWLMITNLCFELVAVAVGLAAIAVDFLNSLMIVCCTRLSTLDR